MLQNYFKIAWRNMMRNKISSLLNILGLSIGIACALLIVIFIKNELSYDKFHKDADRIYQVTLNGTNSNGQEFWNGNIAAPVGAALASNIPEIESYTRFYKPNNIVIRYEGSGTDNKFFTEKNVLAVDSNFLTLFDFKAAAGNPATALLKPSSVVITENMAKKYFGTGDAMGKVLLLNENKKPFIVTAVLKNIPSQSSLQFDFLTPVADYPVVKRMNWSWVWQQTMCYVKLRDNIPNDPASAQGIEAKFPAVVRVQAATAFKRIGRPFDEFISKGGKWNYHLFPLTKIHLYSGDLSMPNISHISSIKYVYIFGSIAFFIIILACVNFMNLSTARASKRAKEIGVRKVAGSTRPQLIRQFLVEAFLFTLISALLAVLIVFIMLGPFSAVTGEQIDPNTTLSPAIWLAVACMVLFISLLAGSYPAFYLTSFNPVSVLKGSGLVKSGKGNVLIRNGLVVFQFTISTIIIVSTLIVYRQLQYFRNANMGFDKENVLIITSTNRLEKSEEAFRQTISQLPGIVHASITSSIPTGALFGDGYEPVGEENEHLVKDVDLNSFMVDENFIPTLKINVIKGRNFSTQFKDSASVIVNEEAVKQIGWKNPVGKWMKYPGNNNQLFKVVGVVKNFNVESLHTAISPFALFHTASKTYDLGVSNIIARIKPGEISHTIDQLESKWKSFVSGEPFDYKFLDSEFDARYRSEQRLGNLFTIFASLSIFIACLGLFGLCAFMAERRNKEIGVRKVLGASVNSLVLLLSKDFLRLTIIAAFIAFPIAWYAMHKWLEDFAYRIDIGWEVFVIAGLATVSIAIITISYQAIKAAMINPVSSLRSE